MSKSLSSNIAFNVILTVSNYLFPFLVYPYVTRVLGPDSLGICNFADSIVTWASLISLIGVPIVGVRIIAKSKGDKERMSQDFTSLFIISGAFTILASAGLLAATILVPKLSEHMDVMLIGQLKLWGNFLLLEWLFKGLEDFKYITVRTIIVKLIFIATVYIFVRSESEYTSYFLLLCLSVAVNAAINCLRASRLVSFRFSFAAVRSLILPSLILGSYLVLTSMYTTFNVMYLGFVAGEAEVGYYTTATKIFHIILAMYTAYSLAILPRASSLLGEGRKEEFGRLISMSVDALIMFAIPIAIFGMLYSRGVVYTIAGEEFAPTILPVIITMPLLFIIGYEQILVVQVMIPLTSDRGVLVNSIVGATVGVAGNLLIVRHLASVGSAIVWFAAEIAVLVIAQRFVSQKGFFQFPWRSLFRNILGYAPFMALSGMILYIPLLSPIVKMIIGGIILIPYFYAVQRFYLKNPVFGKLQDAVLGYVRAPRQ